MAPAANLMSDEIIPDIPIPADHTWKHDKKIGAGSEGTAHLWCLLNTSQKPVRRIVIKNLRATSSHIIQDGPAKGQLLQAYIQQKLVPSGFTEAYTVPTLAARKMHEYENAWRTCHPYYSMGHLESLVRVNTRSRHSKFLPEPFIWFTFHRMMKAAVAMDERLQSSPGDGPVVIHNDIKPENIFLDHPGSLGRDSDYIMYPPAYLGDFGMSYLTTDDESWRHKIRGTVGWCAPELDRGGNPDAPKDKARYDIAPTSRTNVWQIGYCILRAMEGDALEALDLSKTHDLSYRNDNWTKRTPEGASAVYSAELIQTVENCVRFDVADRFSPQEALAAIEQHMPTFADGMDRWGTLSWVKTEHARTSEAKDGDDAEDLGDEDGAEEAVDEEDTRGEDSEEEDREGEAEEEEGEDKDTTTDSTVSAAHKRKAAAPPAPSSKRPRFSGALKTRLKLVATQMKLGATVGKVRKADQTFILAEKHKIICPDDKLFDADKFFEIEDPGPIEFEREKSDSDTQPQHISRPRAASASPVRAPRETPAARAKSTSPIRSEVPVGGIHYFAAGDRTTLRTTRPRHQAAVQHWQSASPDPTTISTLEWRLEQKRLSYNSKHATNLHEKMYWLSRSVQAEYYANNDFDTGRGSNIYIGLAISIWRTSLDDGMGAA